MFVKEFVEDKWLFVNEDIDFNQLYGEEYEKRINENYYSPIVLEKRKNFVERFTNWKTCIDFGCGRFPVMEGQKLLEYDPYVERFKKFDVSKFLNSDTLLVFDVLEHFFDLKTILTLIPQKKLIGTIPIVPNNTLKGIEQLEGWKHRKDGEHYHYFTENGFKEFMKICGWNVVCFETAECPPRSDIYSFYCERIG